MQIWKRVWLTWTWSSKICWKLISSVLNEEQDVQEEQKYSYSRGSPLFGPVPLCQSEAGPTSQKPSTCYCTVWCPSNKNMRGLLRTQNGPIQMHLIHCHMVGWGWLMGRAPTWSWCGAGGGAVVQFWRAGIDPHNKHPERLFLGVQRLKWFFWRLGSTPHSSTPWVQL